MESVDPRRTDRLLYELYEAHPQPAGRLLTVEGAEDLHRSGLPWPISGDHTATRPVRPPLRCLLPVDGLLASRKTGMTVGQVLEEWLDMKESVDANGIEPPDPNMDRHALRNTVAGRKAIHSKERRREVQHYIIPRLGSVPLEALTPAHVEELAEQLRNTQGKRGLLTLGKVYGILGRLKAALASAKASGLIDSNPAAGVARQLSQERAAA
jgi:hypothetical protein